MRRFFFRIPALLAVCLWCVSGISSAHADTIGESQSFRVNTSYDASGASSVRATLRSVGQHAYFYVDDRVWDALTATQQTRYNAALDVLSSEFDSNIYPRSDAMWGTENTPGVDGDAHVVVLLERVISGSGGYFETINNYSTDRAPDSNGREMVYVSADSVTVGSAKSFLAHEFQHLISFHQHEQLLNTADDVWLNEARSEYNITVAGYSNPFEGSTLQRRMQTFLRTPSDSLTDWPNSSVDYAIATVFTHYLADRFGTDIVSSTEHTTAAGAAAVDEWLARHGADRFGDVFRDWMVAAYLNDRSVDPRYGYTMNGLNGMHVPPTVTAQLVGSDMRADFSGTLKEWQPFWTQTDITLPADASDTAHIRLSGAGDAHWFAAAIAYYRDGSRQVVPLQVSAGTADVTVPTMHGTAPIIGVGAVAAQGSTEAVADRSVISASMVLSVSVGDVGPALAPIPPSVQPVSPSGPVADGDLIRRPGQSDIYVVWGLYRRLLPQGVLQLYGFQNRPVREVGDDVFFNYLASIYIRADGTKPVYAVWPDGTKHWLNITAQQWDASHRDWGAIFTVNHAETDWYRTGPDITR